MPNPPGLSRSTTPLLVASNVARSWLAVVGLQTQQLKENAFLVGEDLLVVLYDSKLPVEDSTNDSALGKKYPNHLSIDAREIASTNVAISVPAWHRITEAAGIGSPSPIRHVLSKGRQQDILMRAFRLTEFHQAPPLPPAAAVQYRDVIKSTTGAFYRRNRSAMEQEGLERSDLLSAGLVWAGNFHHRYRRDDDLSLSIKFLGRYIQQRCAQLAKYGSFNRAPRILYTDTLDTYDHAVVEGPTSDDLTEELKERISFMPRSELLQRLEIVKRDQPELQAAAERLSKRVSKEMGVR